MLKPQTTFFHFFFDFVSFQTHTQKQKNKQATMLSPDAREKLATFKRQSDTFVASSMDAVGTAVNSGVEKARTWNFVNKMEAWGKKAETAVKKAVHKVGDKLLGTPRSQLVSECVF